MKKTKIITVSIVALLLLMAWKFFKKPSVRGIGISYNPNIPTNYEIHIEIGNQKKYIPIPKEIKSEKINIPFSSWHVFVDFQGYFANGKKPVKVLLITHSIFGDKYITLLEDNVVLK